MDIQPPFNADVQLAKACKPAMCALYNPAMLAELFAALDTSLGNPTDNASSSEIDTVALVVVAFVGMQLRGAFTGSPWLASLQSELHPCTSRTSWSQPAGATDEDHQWDASGAAITR